MDRLGVDLCQATEDPISYLLPSIHSGQEEITQQVVPWV